MRRRGLIGFLFGAAASAQAIKPEIEGEVIHAFRLKPKNGECGNCGTVAAPFVIDIPAGLPQCAFPTPQYSDNMGVSLAGPPMQYNGPHNEGVDCTSRTTEVTLRYDEQAVRCSFCNNLFVQDAVVKGK